jgi:plasmid stability protein
MASLTIRNLDDDIKQRLRARVAPGARANLELPAREPMREPSQPGR